MQGRLWSDGRKLRESLLWYIKMKKEFSTAWKSSKQPRKQRKYLAKAPSHIQKNFVKANLSKDLRKKHGIRSLSLRTGDIVKVMRGKFKGNSGKIVRVRTSLQKIEVEGTQVKKADGSKTNVSLRPSNLQITELNLNDKKRNKSIKVEAKSSAKAEEKVQKPKTGVKEDAHKAK